jgi:subtilisin family serine protease
MRFEAVTTPSIDPRLQRLLERRRRGLTTTRGAAQDRGELAVVARVKDVEAWRAASDVRAGATIGRAASGWIVTGRLPLVRLEAVRSAPWMISLKPALPLRPALATTLRDMHARGLELPPLVSGGPGRGAVVGVIDVGCDFAHQNFRRRDGATRILALWNQAGRSGPGSPFGYGSVYDQARIDRALRSADPYRTLGYRPGRRAHGTHVLDVAAGNGLGTGNPGLAPEADILFVHVAASDGTGEEPAAGRSSGDSVQLLEALRFIFDQAGARPCVVNISLAAAGGPRDGTSLVEQGIDAMLRQGTGRAVVIAAANAYDDGSHASGVVPRQGTVELGWDVADAETGSELELWYGSEDELSVELIDPAGKSLGQVEPGQTARARDDRGRPAVFVAHRRKDPNNGDNVIGVFLEKGAPVGLWRLRLFGRKVKEGRFHAWLERDDDGPSCFVPPHDNSHTLGGLCGGQETIVVGAYDGHKPGAPVSWFSSAGPTRDGREKPEFSAPGQDVWAALSESSDGLVRMSGTSMAAPAVAGLAAVLLAEGRARGTDLGAVRLRELLLAAARPVGTARWHPRLGYGRLDARAAVEALQSTRRPAAPRAVAGAKRPAARPPARKVPAQAKRRAAAAARRPTAAARRPAAARRRGRR